MTTSATAKGGRQAGTKNATLPLFDFIEGFLKDSYNKHAAGVEHYAEMVKIAATERGKLKWAHLGRLSQKLKDDCLRILYAYQERRSLQDLAAEVKEVQEERRSLITWLFLRPQEDPRHAVRAGEEIRYFQNMLRELLHHVKDHATKKSRRREAALLLAALNEQ